MSAHAPLPPSGAAAWVCCAMWRHMLAAFPENSGDSEASAEGTAAHHVAEQRLRGVMVSEGSLAPNGIEVTDEMIEGAELYCDTVGSMDGGHIESRVHCRSIHPDNWGTPDFWRFRNGILTVIDYKFGRKFVDPFENWQLLDYACGATDELGLESRHVQHIVLTVVQPRSYCKEGPVRSWSISMGQLIDYSKTLKAAAEAATAPGTPVATPGGHCDYCPGRLACVALQRAGYAGCDLSMSAPPHILNATEASRELAALVGAIDRMKQRASGMEEQLMQMLRRGEAVPDWTVERGEGRQKWAMPPEQVITLGNLMGLALGKPAVITPKQAIKAGMPGDLVNANSITPVGELKLVRVDTRKSRRAFAA